MNAGVFFMKLSLALACFLKLTHSFTYNIKRFSWNFGGYIVHLKFYTCLDTIVWLSLSMDYINLKLILWANRRIWQSSKIYAYQSLTLSLYLYLYLIRNPPSLCLYVCARFWMYIFYNQYEIQSMNIKYNSLSICQIQIL